MTRYGLGVVFGVAVVHASPVAQAKQRGARLERIADGVYAIIHDAADEQFPNGNTGVVVGDDGVLVVDAAYLPSHAKADIALIRSVTDKPVRYLVITHEARLAAGTDSAGHALAPSATAELEQRIAQRRAELHELSTLRVITPDVAVRSELDLFLGSRRVQVKNRGRAHSPEDVSVYLPIEGVLFSGDIVVQSPMPFTAATWPVEWSAALHDIESERITAVMPGHGPVMRDLSYVRALHALIDGVTAQVSACLARGMTLDQIQQSVDVTRLRAGSPAWSGSALDDPWKTTVRALVERAWHELRGLD